MMTSTELREWVEAKGFSHAEAANALGMTVPGLRSLIYRPDRLATRATTRIVELYDALAENNLCPEAYFSVD